MLLSAGLLSVSISRSFAESEFPRKLSRQQLEAPVAGIIASSIRNGKITGAVVLIGNREEVILHKAFGFRSVKPKKLPMKPDTIFDLASLTKAVATTTAVMQLVDKGWMNIEDPVAKYWPEFGTKGKERITVRELLTHYSGLRPDLDLKPEWSGYETALRKIVEEKPVASPSERFVYSDINFEVLGELVRRISGRPLDIYCSESIFKPLGMKDTVFTPSAALCNRVAPTQFRHGKKGKMLQGEVHDPTACNMGGVAGHAGLFSTAPDLSLFSRMLLRGGSIGDLRILSPASVETMTTPQSPPGAAVPRGLGWDVAAPFASNRNELFRAGSYGHKGFTGTYLWIDPVSGTYIIILTNRVHPEGKGDAGPIRAQITELVSKSLGPVSAGQVLAIRPSLSGFWGMTKGSGPQAVGSQVQTGIDVLEAEKFSSLKGLRVGLITNHSGLDSAGRRSIDVFSQAPGMSLAALFAPEHGISGNVDEKVDTAADLATGLPVYSLYGEVRRPTEKMLEEVDALVFDIQDAGARFYTYITTLGYSMEAAAQKGIPFYVLDRPNPITASLVQGPLLDEDLRSFTGYFPLPVRHGMTVGELAAMFNGERKIGADLHIIKMNGYRRTDWYDETGLPWVNPSPNLRSLTETILYPGVALVEGANVSVGRGTDRPFEVLGAPWIRAEELTAYLNNRKIPGVLFEQVDFRPESGPYKNRVCHGIRVVMVDRRILDSPALGVEIVSALRRLYPRDFQIDKTLGLVGSRDVLRDIRDGKDPSKIVSDWQGRLDEFSAMRSRYLLY